MRNILLVGWREVWQQIRSRGFALTTILTPALVTGIWMLSGVLGSGVKDSGTLDELAKAERPALSVGYVDRGGFVRSMPPGIPENMFLVLPDEKDANLALQEKRIEAYYVLPPDYPGNSDVRRVSARLPLMFEDRRFLEWMLVWNLLPGRSVEDVVRLREPFGPQGLEFVPLNPQSLPGDSQRGPGFAPFIVAMVIVMPLFMAGGYLLQGLAQEKENRIIEILLVSLRPWQLLAGKLLGLGTLMIIQLGAWILISSLAAKVAGHDLQNILQTIDLTEGEQTLVIVYAVGGFLLNATLMAGLGAIAPNIESTRMWAFVITLPMMLPMFLGSSINIAPNGPLAIFLSILPFSSPVGMIMRLMATTVPAWEVTLSLVLLVVTSGLMLILMSRLFRASTLLSGQPISIRRFWEALRAG